MITPRRYPPADTGRLWVRLISKQAFRQYMKFRGVTNGSLAKEVKCAPATIAFLRSTGKSSRDSVGPELASRIEAALNAPPGSLFAAQVIGTSPSDKGAA